MTVLSVLNKLYLQFTGLESLVYGGHSWSSVRLKSNTLRKLTFSVSFGCLQNVKFGLVYNLFIENHTQKIKKKDKYTV